MERRGSKVKRRKQGEKEGGSMVERRGKQNGMREQDGKGGRKQGRKEKKSKEERREGAG